MGTQSIQTDWIPLATSEVRRMADAGDSDGAALLAADVERYALGKPKRICPACWEPAMLARPWCPLHRPRFIEHADAEPNWQRLTPPSQPQDDRRRKVPPELRAEIRERRRAGEDPRVFCADYGIHWSHAYAIAREGAPMSERSCRRDGSKIQRIVEVIQRDPDLTNAQLLQRFRTSSGTVTRARELAGVPPPEPWSRGGRIGG